MRILYNALFALLAVIAIQGCSISNKFSQRKNFVEFNILQINDVYEITPLEAGRVGGLARVATLLRQLEAENPNTIAVLAGDFLSPSFAGSLSLPGGERIAGLQMVEALNVLGLDYATFGNHEFDLRAASLLQSRMDSSKFEYISCNARLHLGGDTLRFQQGSRPVQDFAIHSFLLPGGQEFSLALVGVVLPFNKAEYVAYLPVEQSFRKAVAAAKQRTPVVIGLTHLSLEEDVALVNAVPGVSHVIGGHEHHHIHYQSGRTAITKADANAKTVYVHRCIFDTKKKTFKIKSKLVAIDSSLAPDPAVQRVVEKWQGIVNDRIKALGYNAYEVLMQAKTTLPGTEQAIRNGQTAFGLLTNQAFQYAWPGADVYLFNSGSLRLDDDLTGAVTAYDVLRTFPYGGPVVNMTLRGDTLIQLLTIGETTNKNEGGYLQRWQAEQKANEWIVGGQKIDPRRHYSVIMPQFVADGKEGNLGFLQNRQYNQPASFNVSGKAITNDIRDLVMAFMKELKVWR